MEYQLNHRFYCLISANQVACGCENGLINIYDLDYSKIVKSFKAHNNSVTDLLL